MSNTPVTNDARETRTVSLPDGYNRVWSGRINIGDLYLHWQRFWSDGVVEWVRMSVEKIIEDGPYYDSVEWFGCVIRDCADEKGYPCVMCGVASPMCDTDFCTNCTLVLYPGESDQSV